MAVLEAVLNIKAAKGVAVGVGLVAVGLLLLPAWRPVTRGAIKGGILAFEKSRECWVRAGESLEDLVAEVRAELAGHGLDEELPRMAALEDSEERPVH